MKTIYSLIIVGHLPRIVKNLAQGMKVAVCGYKSPLGDVLLCHPVSWKQVPCRGPCSTLGGCWELIIPVASSSSGHLAWDPCPGSPELVAEYSWVRFKGGPRSCPSLHHNLASSSIYPASCPGILPSTGEDPSTLWNKHPAPEFSLGVCSPATYNQTLPVSEQYRIPDLHPCCCTPGLFGQKHQKITRSVLALKPNQVCWLAE